jgi:hypothetical protein
MTRRYAHIGPGMVRDAMAALDASNAPADVVQLQAAAS